MKKLIFLRKGMLFEYSYLLKDKKYHLIDPEIQALGFNEILKKLEKTDEYDCFDYLVTTCPTLLNNDIWWNDEEAKWEIYFVDNNELKDIQKYTEKWLRQAHNIERLYLSGGLD